MKPLLVSEKKDEISQETILEEVCEVLEALKILGPIITLYYAKVKKEREN